MTAKKLTIFEIFSHIVRICIMKPIANVFFRQIDIVNAQSIPQGKPLILVANHGNQFLDPIIISDAAGENNRLVRYICAASSFKKIIVGFFARVFNAVPVVRPMDIAKDGPGSVIEIKDNIIIGDENCDFEKISANVIVVKTFSEELIVDKILSKNQLKIKNNPVINKKFDQPKKYKCIPKIDHSEMYKEVYNTLKDNDCIGIFPEGGSHDQTRLLPFKAGVCIMALGAMDKYDLDVYIQPCGLTYFQAHKIRSRVVLQFSDPFKVPQELKQLYREDKRLAVAHLLQMIQDKFNQMIVQANSFAELKRILLAKKLYLTDKDVSTERDMEIARNFAKGYQLFTQSEQIQKEYKHFHDTLEQYRKILSRLHIQDNDILNYQTQFGHNALQLLYALFQFIVALLFSLPGLVLYAPYIYVIRRKSQKERIRARNSSSVKWEAYDVVASARLQLGIWLLPTAHFIYTIIFYFYGAKYFEKPAFLSTLIFFILNPIYLYLLVQISASIKYNFKVIRAKLLFLIIKKDNVKKIQCIRNELCQELKEIDKKYKKQIQQFTPDSDQFVNTKEFQIQKRNSFQNIEIRQNIRKLIDIYDELDKKIY